MLKYQFWKKVTSEKWNSDALNTFTTYLSSLLGVIAIVFSNHAQKWRQMCPKVFNPPEFHFSEVTFFQNWYFRTSGLYIKIVIQNFSALGVKIPHKYSLNCSLNWYWCTNRPGKKRWTQLLNICFTIFFFQFSNYHTLECKMCMQIQCAIL